MFYMNEMNFTNEKRKLNWDGASKVIFVFLSLKIKLISQFNMFYNFNPILKYKA